MWLVVTCWERADLLALVCGVQLGVCHFPIGILGLVWYLIVLIPDLCTLTYFVFSFEIKKQNIYLKDRFNLCMQGNFSLLTFFKLSFKKIIWEHYQMSNCLDQDQDRYCVGPDLCPNCLKILSADDKSRH